MIKKDTNHKDKSLKIIVVANQKGGVGKTTVCINLAVQALQNTKKKIALLDLDPQHSLKTWFALRNENRVSATKRLVLLESTKADFALELERLKEDGFGYVFIDTPPVDKTWMARVFAFSDLVVVPTKAGPFDIAAARPTIQMALDKEIPVRWFFSGVILPKPEVKEIAIELLKTAKVCPGVVKELGDVVRATQLGMGISEFNPESPASSAYYLNWLDIQNELSKTSEFKHRI